MPVGSEQKKCIKKVYLHVKLSFNFVDNTAYLKCLYSVNKH